MMKVVILISGRGSNMLALIRNQQGFEVTAVISDKAQAAGLQKANQHNVAVVESYDLADFCDRKAQKKAIYSRILELKPDLICLAGFMQIIDAAFVQEFFGRIINIHPSLLPRFPGLNTHRQALMAGAREHGCSVHIVDAGMDTGPVIAQAKCEISSGDSEQELENRVLELEHQLYPWVVAGIAQKEIAISTDSAKSNLSIKMSESIRKDAKARKFHFPV